MINSLHDYRRYRKADLQINGKFKLSRKEKMKDFLFPEPNTLFLKALRRYEYYLNTSGIINKLLLLFYYIRFRRISHKTGISIPKNVFGDTSAGLSFLNGVEVINVTGGSASDPAIYLMRGRLISGGYERWISVGSASATNPSGNPIRVPCHQLPHTAPP